MIRLVHIFSLLAAWVIQVRFCSLLAIRDTVPDPGLLILLLLVPHLKTEVLYVTAFVYGLLVDFSLAGLTGVHAFAYLPAVFYTRLVIPGEFRRRALSWSLQILVPLLLAGLLYYLPTLAAEHYSWGWIFLRVVLPAVFYNWTLLIILRSLLP